MAGNGKHRQKTHEDDPVVTRSVLKSELSELKGELTDTKAELRSDIKTAVEASEKRQDEKMDRNMQIIAQSFQETHDLIRTSARETNERIDDLTTMVEGVTTMVERNAQELAMHEHGDTAHETMRKDIANNEQRIAKLEAKTA